MIRDRSAPGGRVTLLADEWADSGVPLELAGRVLAFSFEEDERQADRVTLDLDNFDLSLFDRTDLVLGAVLEISWGYPEQMATPQRVVIQKLRGFQTLTVEGRATSVLLDKVARTRAWRSQTRSSVVQEIARENGFIGPLADIEETRATFDAINQTAETDARFLRRLADEEGFAFFIDDSGLHFHERRQDQKPARVFTWFSDPGQGEVLDLQVETAFELQAAKETVTGRDPLTKETFVQSSSNENSSRTTLAEVVEVVDPETGRTRLESRNATANVHASAATNAAEAMREAEARFRKSERAAVQLSMRVVGDPLLRAKQVVEVRGISRLLSGKYFVTSVKHSISAAGYVCELSLTSDGTGLTEKENSRPQGGTPNTEDPVADASDAPLREVEVVDPETGMGRIEWR